MKRSVNLAVTLAAVVATVLPALAGGPDAGWVLPLALASSVPVLWRERALVPVSLTVGVATTLSASLGAPPLLPVGPLVCLYTFAARASLRLRLLGIAVTAAGLLVSVLFPKPDVEVLRYLAVAFIFAYALGTSVRARRDRESALAERELRLAGERAAAVLRERTRIARDLHDIVTHALGVIVVQAEAGPLVVRTDPDRADAAFAAIAATGRDAVGQLRRAVAGLREPADRPLDQPGLAQLPALLDRVRATGLAAELTVAGTPFTPPADVGVAAYRIVQEALTNVLRHARAGTVRVALDYLASSLTVSITDDGCGPAAVGPPGYGIVGMRERAQACGGSLRAGAVDGGFAVSATLPAGPLPVAATLPAAGA
ncbi:signal transduction histidine kinase [Actinoplanes octamycinicus]|uniref:histidine kinase n=1 Tax=Actinoplanes octamycinicus TaxID=135948 RepID=A0A7W7H449_9ACTN|nr:sensor histidine kinase [Actinoplanes octamycinicus]MBB4743646.1 signal transduction histidine kinase [Actinoplanes octamycinicus]GIE61071.1 two-component sensor histidine kinase [Actinoplanes octamycinicus]